MNKKREALRRGLRTFIEDTSRELADLEGEDLLHSARGVPAATEQRVPPLAAQSATAGAAVGAPPLAAPVTPPIAEPPPRPPHAPIESPARAPMPSPAVDFQGGASRTAGGEPRVNENTERTPRRDAAPPLRTERIVPQGPPPEVEHPASTQAPVELPGRDAAAARPPYRPAKSPRRAPGPAHRQSRSRIAAEIGANGVSAEQVHARKGVCLSYFVNHECWRVPDAYCLTALQVCITRECPVYHLHKESLERRFARKFKHFW